MKRERSGDQQKNRKYNLLIVDTDCLRAKKKRNARVNGANKQIATVFNIDIAANKFYFLKISQRLSVKKVEFNSPHTHLFGGRLNWQHVYVNSPNL